jgi:cell division protein FtsB
MKIGRRAKPPYLYGCVQPKLSYSLVIRRDQLAFPKTADMSVESEPRPERKPQRGPEPLRRKRVQPAPVVSSPRSRKVLNIVLGFATAVLLIDSFVGDKGLLAGLRARDSYEQAEAALFALKAENARLRETVSRYRDDPTSIESIARQDLGFIKPGEVLFIVRDVTPASR